MSKLLDAFLLVSILVILPLALTSCGKDEKEKPETVTSLPVPVTPPEEPLKPAPSTEAMPKSPESGSPTTDTTREKTTLPEPGTPAVKLPQPSKTDQMLALARKSGCLACHSVDRKVVGPAWNEVANFYKDDSNAREKLVEKVASGGRGNWSHIVGNVAMPPYFPRVTRKDIGHLVDFVLSLEDE